MIPSGTMVATLLKGGAPPDRAVFADGTDGFLFDMAIQSQQFTNTAGTTSVTAAGQSIARTNDQSGRGNNGTQSTSGARPTWQSAGLARFDGLDDNWLTGLVAGTTMTLLCKFKAATAGGVLFGSIQSGPLYSYLGIDTSGRLGGACGSRNLATIFGGPDIRNQTHVGALVYTPSGAKLYLDAVQVYSDALTVTSVPTAPYIVGAANNAGSAIAFSAADIYKVLSIKKALIASEIQAITNQWGTT